jgi:hypothetical protein
VPRRPISNLAVLWGETVEKSLQCSDFRSNGYCESFNGKLRDELLDGEIFYTLKEEYSAGRSAQFGQIVTLAVTPRENEQNLQSLLMLKFLKRLARPKGIERWLGFRILTARRGRQTSCCF